MFARSVLASLVCVLVGVVASAGGCATGGDATPPVFDASGDATGDTSQPGMCSAPKIECGKSCVDPTTDNANCGGCNKHCPKGEVCSSSKCGLVCTGGTTLCSGAPFDAGAMEASGMDTGAAEASADAGDAAGPTDSGSPKDAGGKKDSGADAGSSGPYCANLNDDSKNCGVCGKECDSNETCVAGECVLHCAKGETVCPDNKGCKGPGECCSTMDCTNIGESCPAPGGKCTCPPDQTVCAMFSTCIPSTSCCTDKDCSAKVTGEVCMPSPGGSCVCPSGQTPCDPGGGMMPQCIPNGSCCTSMDCSVSGEVCSGPGGGCACPAGQMVCPASNLCISTSQCCTAADCPPTSEVSATNCTMGACGIQSCDSGWVDVDGNYANGCECQDDAYGKTCASITNLGGVAVGGSLNRSGVLPLSGETNWFEVDFTQTTSPSFHAKIQLTTNPGSEFLFNVYDASCAGTSLACGDGGKSTARTVWEVIESDPGGTITPTVGSAGGVVYIEVYRASASPTCDAYTLTISD